MSDLTYRKLEAEAGYFGFVVSHHFDRRPWGISGVEEELGA
jgi:hypothetical protein